MSKKILALFLALMMTVVAVGCDNAASANPTEGAKLESTDQGNSEVIEPTEEPTKEVTAEPTTEPTEEPIVIEKTWYEEFMDRSIVSTGNNSRIKKVLEKARSGETVNMAILGGSITEGALADPFSKGYAYLFADAFKETYCSGDNLNFVNAGISGTPSALGVMRYERDVVKALGAYPDLLVIEFAVNDWQEPTGCRALESLIYEALSDNEDCAVIILFSVSKGKWNVQNDMIPYGKYYSVPMVSMLDAIKSTDRIGDDMYFADEYHPTTYGHTVVKDCLMNLLATMDAAKENVALKVPNVAKKGRQFAYMKLVNDGGEDIKLSKGAFTGKDTEIQNDYFTKGCVFADNFMKDKGAGDPMKLTVTCKTLLIDYKKSGSTDFGNAEVYVDGKLVSTLEGYVGGGWNNHTVTLIIDDKEAKEHTVEIKMASGSEKKKFTIYAISYN